MKKKVVIASSGYDPRLGKLVKDPTLEAGAGKIGMCCYCGGSFPTNVTVVIHGSEYCTHCADMNADNTHDDDLDVDCHQHDLERMAVLEDGEPPSSHRSEGAG